MRHVPTLLICWRYFEMVSSKRLSQPWISQFLMRPEPNAVNFQLGISDQLYMVPKYNIRNALFPDSNGQLMNRKTIGVRGNDLQVLSHGPA